MSIPIINDSIKQRLHVKGTNLMYRLLLLRSSRARSSSSLDCSCFSCAKRCLLSQALCFSGSKLASNLMNNIDLNISGNRNNAYIPWKAINTFLNIYCGPLKFSSL